MIEIKNKEDCCGCHACYNICPSNAIRMEEDEYGFKFPIIDEKKCINCGLCEKVCPILKRKFMNNSPKAYGCINKNNEIRENSSSGGIFFLIAEAVLELNGIIFGAKFNANFEVEHNFIDNKDRIFEFMGSKYVQSSINDTYKNAKKFLESDRYVLFSGTPCQIDGLKCFLQKDYEKLFTQDIVCHGVPSPMVWRNYKDYISKKFDISSVNFRNKDNGWNNYNTQIRFDNLEYKVDHEKDLYMKAFLNDIILRDSCYSCKFKNKNRNSDITLADFWGIENIDKEFFDNKGTSLVIINSEKGEKLFNMIQEKILYKEFNFDEAIKFNKSMLESSKKNKNRDAFLNDFKKIGIERSIKKYIKNKNIFRRVKSKLIKKIFGKR